MQDECPLRPFYRPKPAVRRRPSSALGDPAANVSNAPIVAVAGGRAASRNRPYDWRTPTAVPGESRVRGRLKFARSLGARSASSIWRTLAICALSAVIWP